MINFVKPLPKNNKKGLTLVEIVVGVVILSIFTVGVITALVTASTNIAQKSQDSAAHTKATQMMDAVISTISNGSYDEDEDIASAVKSILGFGNDVTLTVTPVKYTLESGERKLRGWKLKLSYNGVDVTGFTSDTKGEFDRDAIDTDI